MTPTEHTHDDQQHTPEPWVADIPYIHAGDDEYNVAEFYAVYGRDRQWADVRRAVACVNACKGWSTEALEKFAAGDHSDMAPLAAELVADIQRSRTIDQKLAAYRAIADYAYHRELCRTWRGLKDDTCTCGFDEADRALAALLSEDQHD